MQIVQPFLIARRAAESAELRTAWIAALSFVGFALGWFTRPAMAADGRLVIRALDEATGAPLAVRMTLRDARGRTVKTRPANAIVAGTSFYFAGETTLDLRRGDYQFLIEAGPEYRTRPGTFAINRGADDASDVTLLRRVDMQKEGWRAGDLDFSLPADVQPSDVPLMMRARGLDMVPRTVASAPNGRRSREGDSQQQLQQAPGGADAIPGPWAATYADRRGRLLVVGEPGIDVAMAIAAGDSSLEVATAGKEAGATVVAMSAASWDLPLWVAAGKLDAVQIISRGLPPYSDSRDESDRPFDKTFFPGKQGPGRFAERIYHHLLNCGLYISPAAGSGSGAPGPSSDAPIGEARAYVHVGEECTPEQWLAGLRDGKVSVTNGPLLRTHVEGEPPGAIFPLDSGRRRAFQIGLDLTFYEQNRVDYLEIIKNGVAVEELRLEELARQGGKLPPVEFDDSGWFLVRAVTDAADRYQFATSGAYFVESKYRPRISRRSVAFFQDWLDAAAAEFADEAAALEEIDAARPFWQALAQRANAE